MQNYFKGAGGTLYFFDNGDLMSIRSAFDTATAAHGRDISVFKVVGMSGPWDRLAVIGHRKRGEILSDLSAAQTALDVRRLEDELVAVTNRYREVGRNLPPQVVEAA